MTRWLAPALIYLALMGALVGAALAAARQGPDRAPVHVRQAP